MFKKLQNRRQHIEIIKHGFLEDVRVFTSHEALARALFFPLNSSIHCLDPVFCSRKEKDGERERKGGREEGRKDCETRRKNRPSFFPKVENTFFFYFSAWQRLHGCKCYPVLNQINFPFKKKSKQIGLKEANWVAGTYYVARLK